MVRRDTPLHLSFTTPVPQRQFPQRQRADDKRRGLRAAIAASADDKRDEERQHNGAGNFIFKVSHGRGREHFTEKQT